jgi:hypothetical protein
MIRRLCVLCGWSALYNGTEDADRAKAAHLDFVHNIPRTKKDGSA